VVVKRQELQRTQQCQRAQQLQRQLQQQLQMQQRQRQSQYQQPPTLQPPTNQQQSTHEEPRQLQPFQELSTLQQFQYQLPTVPATKPGPLTTNLNTTEFDSSGLQSMQSCQIPVDISTNMSDSQYNKIFKKYHIQLQLEAHPLMSEEDLLDIQIHGRMYFLKNVKTIVPKVGPWKFHAHVSHRNTDERQYNIPGRAITCKVKEWLTDDGLWRLYHYKKGKVVKSKVVA